MTSLTPLHQAILEVGLEDVIPLPELLGTPEVRAAVVGEPTVEEVGDALVDLLRLGRVSVWCGHWPEEPRRTSGKEAEGLLLDSRRYTFDGETEGIERVYFVNAENIP